jgi:hypothetical protein
MRIVILILILLFASGFSGIAFNWVKFTAGAIGLTLTVIGLIQIFIGLDKQFRKELLK